MKYLIRSVKYFFYLAIILTLVILILMKLKLVDSNPEQIFRNGYDSFWQIALMLAAFAAIYPKFGFSRRNARIPGEFGEIRSEVIEHMDLRGYKLEKQEGENMYFRLRSPMQRVTRMLEDRVTMTRSFDGFELEGATKDVVRIVSFLENKSYRPSENE